ncbi:MAG TPA: DUF6709 family protein [Tepidisphaeraceae bacterium]|nr:DUF6709 family protein [Tepidisphaeraceae bacterium]
MLGQYVQRQIARSNRNVLVVNGLFVAAGAVALVLFIPWATTVVRGPQRVTPEQIAAYRSADDVKDWYVTVPLDPTKLSRSVYQISSRKGGKRHYHYYQTSKGTLIIGTGGDVDPPPELRGVIKSPPGEVTDKVVPGKPLIGRVLPVVLVKDTPMIGFWVFACVWAPITAIAAWNLVKGARRISDPSSHPVARSLGALGDPAALGAALDREMPGAQVIGRKVRVTPSFLVRERAFGLDLIPLADVVWAYKKETKTKSYGVTTNTSYATVVNDRRGQSIECPLTAAQVDQLLATIYVAAPHAIVGYDAQLEQTWKSRRAEFLGAVDARRAAVAAEPPALQGA